MRIASLLPSATELLFAIGAGDEVVAVTHECDHPPAARALPAVTSNTLMHEGQPSAAIDRHVSRARHQGSSIYALDEAALAALAPDLIVTQELCDVCAVGYREVAGAVRRLPGSVEVLSLEPTGLDGIISTALTLGAATGHEAGGRRLGEAMALRVAAVREQEAVRPAPVTVCVEWTEPIMAGGHWVPEMVRLAGGRDPLGVEGRPSRCVDWAEVVAAEPEVMVLMPCGFGLEESLARAREISSRPGFDQLPCSRDGRLVAVDGSAYFNRPGPRIVDGLEMLAAILRAASGAALPAGAAWLPV